MKFNREAILSRMTKSRLGTGTLASAAGMLPDQLQLLLLNEEASEEVGSKLVKVLGEIILAEENGSDSQKESASLPVAGVSIPIVKEKIISGEWDHEIVFQSELSQEEPRTTLLTWIRTEYEVEE